MVDLFTSASSKKCKAVQAQHVSEHLYENVNTIMINEAMRQTKISGGGIRAAGKQYSDFNVRNTVKRGEKLTESAEVS